MPRQQATDIQNNFIRGLITEATGLKFPKDACTEAWNCVFDETGRITRRPGVDAEAGNATFSSSIDTGEAWTEYVWTSVAGQGDISFLVQQKGDLISFFDISSSVAQIGGQKKSFSILLSTFLPSGSSNSPKLYPCKFAQGNGNLIIVNRAIDPVLVTYSITNDSIAPSAIMMKSRDFVGLDDSLTVTRRLTESVSSLKTNNPKHYYNILNQGWHATDALSQWDTARTDMPSNADTVPLYRSSATDAFDTGLVTSKSPGNSPAPKGHFILDVHYPNRTAAMVAEGFTGANISGTTALKSLTGTTNIGTVSNPGNAFDGLSTSVQFDNGHSWLGKSFPTPTVLSSIKLINYSGGGSSGSTFYIYAKQGAAPTSNTNGTYLGSVSLGITPAGSEIYINSLDTTTAWDHIWLVYSWGISTSTYIVLQNIEYYAVDTAGAEIPITYARPSSTAFFAGRAWYAGIDGLDLNNTIFFSQIIQRNSQYGSCYQANDPTSENFPDLLSDDGGAVKIPEIATVVHLDTYGNSLLIFATNGVWAISGSNRNYFTATSYGVRKISGIGTNSTTSFVNHKGLPIWWGESGIYGLQYDPNYDSFSVEPLTTLTIFSFINAIPKPNRRYIKGVYYPDNETILWLYNDKANLTTADRYVYNKALEYNGISKAFYPYSFSTGTGLPSIRGAIHAKSANDDVFSRVKFVTSIPTSVSLEKVGFAEYSASYLDWSAYGDGVDSEAYFLTGYAVEAEGSRFFQPSWLFVFMEATDNSSCRVQAIFDWTTSSSTGKWSTAQEIYNSAALSHSIRHRRLKLRGKGKTLQLKFRSNPGKAFTIIGWAIPETSSASV